MTMLQDDSTHLTTTTTHLSSSSSDNKSNNLDSSSNNRSSTTAPTTPPTTILPPSTTPSSSSSPPSPSSSHPPLSSFPSSSPPPTPPPPPQQQEQQQQSPPPPLITHNSCPITTQIVQSLFGSQCSTSPIVSDWTCSHHLASGRLYAGYSGLYFYCNLFGFERKVLIPMRDIGNVARVGQTSIGVETTTKKKGGEEYVFKGFQDREEVWLVVNDLWRRYGSGRVERSSFHVKSSSGGGGGLFKRRHMSVPVGLGLSNGEELRGSGKEGGTVLPTVVSEEDGMASSSSSLMTTTNETMTTGDGTGTKTTTDKEEEEEERIMTWDEHCSDIEKNYKEYALNQFSLPCSISQFKSQFLSDDSPHSIPHYQRTVINDTDINTTPWKTKSIPKKLPNVQIRTISFVHKVNAPVGPNSTRGTKRQCLYEYHYSDADAMSSENSDQQQQQQGLILTTTTTLDDVYNADCFHVSDVWIVTPKQQQQNDDDNGGGIILTVKFKVIFVKSTLWKGVIQSMTKGDMINWYKGYATVMTRAVGDGATAPVLTEGLDRRSDESAIMTNKTTMMEMIMEGLTTLARWMISLNMYRLGMTMGLSLLLWLLSSYRGSIVVDNVSSSTSSSYYHDKIMILEQTIDAITKHHEKQMNDVMTRLMDLETIVEDMRQNDAAGGVRDTTTMTTTT